MTLFSWLLFPFPAWQFPAPSPLTRGCFAVYKCPQPSDAWNRDPLPCRVTSLCWVRVLFALLSPWRFPHCNGSCPSHTPVLSLRKKCVPLHWNNRLGWHHWPKSGQTLFLPTGRHGPKYLPWGDTSGLWGADVAGFNHEQPMLLIPLMTRLYCGEPYPCLLSPWCFCLRAAFALTETIIPGYPGQECP